MNRLLRERGRLGAGVALLVVAAVVAGIGYASVSDEVFVAIQIPDLLGAGVGALLCGGVGLVLLRSHEEAGTRRKLAELEAAHHQMSDRFEALGVQVEYATQLLEAALREDGATPRGAVSGSTPTEVRL